MASAADRWDGPAPGRPVEGSDRGNCRLEGQADRQNVLKSDEIDPCGRSVMEIVVMQLLRLCEA